jgi:hypothetical protein
VLERLALGGQREVELLALAGEVVAQLSGCSTGSAEAITSGPNVSCAGRRM